MKTEQNQSEVLDAQRVHWQNVWARGPSFGFEPSFSAQYAATTFRGAGFSGILELGSGEGRDSLFFLRSGFDLHAVDYAEGALKQLSEKAESLKLGENLNTIQHDIRQPLPFPDNSIDTCYSHMLYCMALTDEELVFLNREILRVLKPGGLNILTARNDSDPACGKGIHRVGMLYELDGGFIVRFFNDATVEILSDGYEVVKVQGFEEGGLPKRLTMLTLKKPAE